MDLRRALVSDCTTVNKRLYCHHMHPRLISTPYFTVYTFGVLLAIAYLSALWWVVREARRAGMNADLIISMCLWAIVGAIVGAKAMMIFRSLPEYLANPNELWSLATLQSAGDFYGGFFGALAAVAVFFMRHRDLPFWPVADLCGPAIALGQGIGRIGCFMAGDDYGSPSRLPWAVTFTHPDAARVGGAPLGVSLHPVQLYESLTCFCIFGFLVWLSRRKKFTGEIILSYALLYAGARFLIEYVRGDADRGFVFGGLFSISQFLAILIGGVSVILFAVRSRTTPAPLERKKAPARGRAKIL
jgi:phosphatidylglycerol---prolipoprotein diacylglyceryl transferase